MCKNLIIDLIKCSTQRHLPRVTAQQYEASIAARTAYRSLRRRRGDLDLTPATSSNRCPAWFIGQKSWQLLLIWPSVANRGSKGMRDMHEFAVDVRNPLSTDSGVDRNGRLLTAVTAYGFVWVQFSFALLGLIRSGPCVKTWDRDLHPVNPVHCVERRWRKRSPGWTKRCQTTNENYGQLTVVAINITACSECRKDTQKMIFGFPTFQAQVLDPGTSQASKAITLKESVSY